MRIWKTSDDHNDRSFLNVFPKGDIYSWYKGNIFPDDMEPKKKERGVRFVYLIIVVRITTLRN